MIDVPMPEQPQLSSSPTSIPSNAASPSPPQRLGHVKVHQTELVRLRDDVDRMVECSSYSAAFGRISFVANSRASARSSFCSDVRANETPPATPVSSES